ncbi:MAG: DUF4345 domain-containing protein [Alphaproteobacteria bacterium]|nr:DUF4345 domain-containing protein [Alphaproteobacteria bacterium]
MTLVHQIVLYAALIFLGLSLLIPGVIGVVRPETSAAGKLVAEGVDAQSHLRALNAMMAAVGALALWACIDLAGARTLVLALGVILGALVPARLWSVARDGAPGAMTWVYIVVEAALAALFLLWPPPA